jgi:hypothetical protein
MELGSSFLFLQEQIKDIIHSFRFFRNAGEEPRPGLAPALQEGAEAHAPPPPAVGRYLSLLSDHRRARAAPAPRQQGNRLTYAIK